jgi:hypothetical protein
MPPCGTQTRNPRKRAPQTHALDRGYTEARTNTTQQSGQTPDKEVEIKKITVYVNGDT